MSSADVVVGLCLAEIALAYQAMTGGTGTQVHRYFLEIAGLTAALRSTPKGAV